MTLRVQISPILFTLLASFALGALGCSADGEVTPTPTQSGNEGDADDRAGPTIFVEPIDDGQPRGEAIPVTATITDPSGISFAALYFQPFGLDYWASEPLAKVGADTFEASIPAEYVGEEGIRYFIEARDGSFNRNVSYYPTAGVVGPAFVSTLADAAPFPAFFDFEVPDPEDGTRPALGQTGWTGYVLGFSDYENWVLTDRTAASGRRAAYHDHGSPYQTQPFEDWLVSPPINLGDAETVELSWSEYLDASELASHRLMISLGSPDPRLGQFVPVLDPLPAGQEDGWQGGIHVDLSPWAGYSQVFLAFVYEGIWADDWGIDDVRLGAHAPALALVEATFEPEGVRPGESAALYVTLENRGLLAAEGVEISLVSDDPALEISPGTLSLEGLPPGDRATLGPFALSVSAQSANHRYIPLTLRQTAGEGTLEEDLRLRVGRPAQAFIAIEHAYQNDIELFLGYGDLDAPSVYIPVQVDGGRDESGIFTWDVDLTPYEDALPPSVGANRWFVEVRDDSAGNVGTLEAFWIAQGEGLFESAGLPRAIPDDGASVFAQVPGRAELELDDLVVTPGVVSPGSAVTVDLSVLNLASPPQGPITGRLVTTEPFITGLDSDPRDFSYVDLPAGQGAFGVAAPLQPWTFTVTEDHDQSEDLDLTLVLTDGFDDWTLALSIPVPWPVLGGVVAVVNDAAFEDAFLDYGLTPTESTGLNIGVVNVGDLPTAGAVTMTVEVVDDQGAGVTLGEGPFAVIAEPGSGVTGGGLVPGGRGKSALVPITIDTGTLETVITLAFTFTDGVVTHRAERDFPVLQPPWNPALPGGDAVGDARSYQVDLVSGEIWRRDTLIRMRWTAAEAWNPLDGFVYAYLSRRQTFEYAFSLAYGQPLFFRWISQGGDAGYWSRYLLPPESFAVYPIDGKTVEFTIDLKDISMQTVDLYAGASAGQCGTQVCDAAPDAAKVTGGLFPIWW